MQTTLELTLTIAKWLLPALGVKEETQRKFYTSIENRIADHYKDSAKNKNDLDNQMDYWKKNPANKGK